MAYTRLDLLKTATLPANELELYRQHVVHYFDTQLVSDIVGLPQDKKERMFKMFHDYSDILVAIFHEGHGVINHIVNRDPVHLESDNVLIREYDQWRWNNNIDNVNPPVVEAPVVEETTVEE